jgi:hypothetical protein
MTDAYVLNSLKHIDMDNTDDIAKIANSIFEDIKDGYDNEITAEVLGELDDIDESIKSIIFNLYRMEQRGTNISDIIGDNVSRSLREYIVTEIGKLRKLEHGTTP